jgi:hypothetical protein
MINEWHKETLFLLEVLESTTRDPIQGDAILGLFW